MKKISLATIYPVVILELSALILFAMLPGTSIGQTSASQAPLLMDGKKTLFQRVIIHPNAKSYSAPQEGEGKAIKPFSVFYVYERQDKNGEKWLKVSPSSSGQNLFWVPASSATDWKQSLTLLFTDRMGRQPVLFFNDMKSLENICETNNIASELTKLSKQFQQYSQKGEKHADFPVLAMEPSDEQGAVARSRFYIMPIFDWADPFSGVKFLNVASIDPGSGSSNHGAEDKNQNPGRDGDNSFKTAIAFVIDTTISMRPYIEQSLQVARSIYDAVEKEKINDKVALAVVAFRSSTKATPGLEYDTKIISQFKQATERKSFEDALGAVKEASVSSHSFNEDSYAGILAAIEKLDWNSYQSRIIMLITDAGPLESSDEYASTRMGGEELADLAKSRGIKLIAAHVKTPAGKKNHTYAAREYDHLTRMPGSQNAAYYGLNAATPEKGAKAFGQFASSASKVFVDLVKRTAENTSMPRPKAAHKDTPEEMGQWIAENLGYSIQLNYLGEKKGNRAPEMVPSWISDMDLAQLAKSQSVPAVEVAVLISKAQLSALQAQLKIIVDNAERTKKTDSKDFFQSILSASAQMSRDPNMFSLKPNQNLQQLGVLAEFLDDLPYKSHVLNMTEEDWYNMPIGQQTAFINRLKAKIARYDEYEKDIDNWESFGASNSDDWLYRVPLNMLP